MPNILDILARAQSLMNETALNSITPPRAGGIMYDTLLVLNQMQLEGASLLISKVYASVSAMEADTTPTSDLTGRALKPGQLVVIVTSDASSSDMGSEYRYNGPGSWTYVGKVGGLPLDTVPTENSTKGITSGGVFNVKKDLEDDIESLAIRLNGATKIYTKNSGLTSIYSGYEIKVPSPGTALANTTRANGTNYRNYRVPVTGASRVIYNSFASTAGYGSMFVDSDDNVISGYSRVSSVPNPITLDVPENAVYFIWSINISNSDEFNTIQVIIDAEKIPTSKLEDGAVTSPKIAAGAVTSDKLAPDSVDGAITGEERTYVGFNLLNPETSQIGYINKNTGAFVSQSSGIYATDFIPVSTKGLYAYNGQTYGTTGGCAVYDSNKSFLRNNGSAKDYTYQEGDGFVRFTYKATNDYQVICEKPAPNITGTFAPDYIEQTIKDFKGTQRQSVANIPETMPAISQSGQDGLAASSSSLSSNYLRLDAWPRYLKNQVIITAFANFAVAGEVRLGLNRNSSTAGYFVRVTDTNLSICKYSGTDTYVTLKTEAHGLTLSDFVAVVFKTGFLDMKAEMMTGNGAFKMDYQSDSSREIYGLPFIEAIGDTTLTTVQIRAASPKLRKSIWFIGDSYVSYYSQRWPVQLSVLFDESNYLVDGLAGGTSDDMLPELIRLLSLGTPKFLVWCLGMNDNVWNWRYYEKQVEMLCRSKGITLVLQTIPQPVGGASKSGINSQVRESGYRFIDAYSAVCDSNGDWYAGMCDDDVHPTVLGAKSIAARVIADLPEVCQ